MRYLNLFKRTCDCCKGKLKIWQRTYRWFPGNLKYCESCHIIGMKDTIKNDDIVGINRENCVEINRAECLFGLHNWEKYSGPTNLSNGKFKQLLICSVCKKKKTKVS